MALISSNSPHICADESDPLVAKEMSESRLWGMIKDSSGKDLTEFRVSKREEIQKLLQTKDIPTRAGAIGALYREWLIRNRAGGHDDREFFTRRKMSPSVLRQNMEVNGLLINGYQRRQTDVEDGKKVTTRFTIAYAMSSSKRKEGALPQVISAKVVGRNLNQDERYFKVRRFAYSDHVCESYLSSDPESHLPAFHRAEVALARHKDEEAIESIRQSLALRPFEASAVLLLGRIQACLGNNEKAIATFKRATELSKDKEVRWRANVYRAWLIFTTTRGEGGEKKMSDDVTSVLEAALQDYDETTTVPANLDGSTHLSCLRYLHKLALYYELLPDSERKRKLHPELDRLFQLAGSKVIESAVKNGELKSKYRSVDTLRYSTDVEETIDMVEFDVTEALDIILLNESLTPAGADLQLERSKAISNKTAIERFSAFSTELVRSDEAYRLFYAMCCELLRQRQS